MLSSCQSTSTETQTDIMYHHSESGFILIWIYLQPTSISSSVLWSLLEERSGEEKKIFSGTCFLPPTPPWDSGQHDSQTPIHFNQIPLIFFACLSKYSLVHRLLAPAGLRSGRSRKLMFFPLCTSCCGLNLSVLSRPDHLSDRFLICFPHLLVEEGLSLSLSLRPWLKIGSAVICSVLGLGLFFCLPSLALSSLVSSFDMPCDG